MTAPPLDRAQGAPETAGMDHQGGAAATAAAVLADKTPSRAPASRSQAATPQVVAKIGRMGDRLSAARRLAHDATTREALTRSELTLALNDALIGRAQALADRQAVALRAFLTRAPTRKPGRRNRLNRALDGLLIRLGRPGQALVIARAGVWTAAGGLDEIRAYVRRGPDPAAQPATLFDQGWYLDAYPDVAGSGLSPLAHYLISGADEGRSPHPLFDAAGYRRDYAADLAATGLSPLAHYLQAGAALGRTPHPLFDVAHYLGQGAEPAACEDPLSHYLREGWRRGLSPHPLFDAGWYLRQLPEGEATVAPLVHYVTTGWIARLSPHPLFEPQWYLEQNPDVAAAGFEPLSHFVAIGGAERRDPSPWFDTPHYAAQRGEGLGPGRNPLIDYLQGGAWGVAEPRPGFPSASYLAASPRLAREGLTPLEHWARQARSQAGQ